MPGEVVVGIPRPHAESVRQLGAFGVACVHESNDTDLLMDPDIRRLTTGKTVSGPAITVHCAPADNAAIHFALEQVTPGDVLVIGGVSMRDDTLVAMIGGVMAEAAAARGAGALVVDGFVRDLDDIRELGLPIWARGTCARGATKSRVESVNLPVTCGGIVVNPGDAVVCDGDGVVVVRADRAPEVVDLAAQRQQRERELLPRLRDRSTSTFDYLNMQEMIDRGSVRVRAGSESQER